MNCGQITADIIGASCGKNVVTGVNTRIILINYDDIDRAVNTPANGVLSSLTLVGSKKGVQMTTNNKGFTVECALAAGTYSNAFTHKITSRVFVKGQEIKTQIDKMRDSLLVAVVQNKDIGSAGDTKYEVYGFYSGLKMSELTANSDDADGIIYSIVLSTDESSKEPSLPLSLFATDMETTDALVDSLIATPGE